MKKFSAAESGVKSNNRSCPPDEAKIVWQTPVLKELDVFDTANGNGLNDGNGVGGAGMNASGS